jgi:hypothetical protein
LTYAILADNCVLAEGTATHEVENVLALALETGGTIRHYTLPLRFAYSAAKIRLAAAHRELKILANANLDSSDRAEPLAKLALAAFRSVQLSKNKSSNIG